jgi:hypothetical protein
MRRSAAALAAGFVAAGLWGPACTTTYNQKDLTVQEQKEDTDAREEEAKDAQEGKEGGANHEGIDDQIDWATQDSEL